MDRWMERTITASLILVHPVQSPLQYGIGHSCNIATRAVEFFYKIGF